MQLLKAGAKTIALPTGQSALHMVFGMTVDEKMLDLLLQYDASPPTPDKSGELLTPLRQHDVPLSAAACSHIHRNTTTDMCVRKKGRCN